MKQFKYIYAIALLVSISHANAAIIVDSAVEQSQNGWISYGGWYNPSAANPYYTGGGIGPEGGNWIAHSNSHHVVNNDVSLGAHTIQEGSYTILFSAGNWNNRPFSNYNITFAGMDESLATTRLDPTPPSGGWSLWSFTWEVDSGSAYLGNVLSFDADGLDNYGNSAIDGVGSFSALGNGFLVDYSPVPEPSILALMGAGLVGLGFARRRKLQA
jgi:hypothetical protein